MSVEGKPNLKVVLGEFGYYIKKVERQYVLYDDNDEAIYNFSKRGLSSDNIKKTIQLKTGASLGTIDQTFAKLIDYAAKIRALSKAHPQRKKQEELPKEAYEKAERILANGDPFKHIQDSVSLLHAGDEDATLVEWISALSNKLSRIKINSWVIGGSGKGKSHLKYSVIQVLPNELYEVFTSASPLSLFYYVKEYGEEALSGVLLYIDEVEASKFALPMLRSLTSQTEIHPRHLSVHEAEILDLKIVGSRAVWFTSVKTFGSEQIKNRFIHLNPDETQEQDERVFYLQDMLFREESGLMQEPFHVAKALARIIIRETENLKVSIPFKIKWVFKERRFLYPIFLAFIQVIAKIRFKKRQRDNQERIVAEREDFELAKLLWKVFGESIMYRVSRSALTIMENLSENPEDAKTHAEISAVIPVSTRWIRNLCDELLNEGLINARKRSREGPGRHAWEYWKAHLPTIDDVEIDEEDNLGISEVPPDSRILLPEASSKIPKLETPLTNVNESSIQEAVEYAYSQMAKRLPDKTTEGMFLHDLQFKGLDKEDAENLLNKLTEEGPLGYDKEGWLVKI